jgi:hypothetical protein
MLGQMAERPKPRWWSVRRAQNAKPATYRCPLCGRHLPALSEHMLMFPEGDHTREEWLKTQPRPPSAWQRLMGRVRRRERA